MSISRLYLLILFLSAFACQSEVEKRTTLFELLDKSYTGVDFRNDLNYNEQFNPYTFRNFYNGAGVALGDINNDGLVDIFLAGNQTGNKLYLNKGNFQFEDITEIAGLAVPGIWSTGVSMADINGDGLLDIYICKSGPLGGEQRHNELFINNGDLTFTEMAKEYGIADEGLSQHAVFFDYDRDGDLDMYLLNNSARSVGINDLRDGQRDVRDPLGGNKLYRNDNGKFVDVSEEAGIYGSAIGYGLGVTVADVNQDGWPDLYVSNDFFEKDYLYINNGDGTFNESLEEMMTEISMGSMGADIADLDNNGWPDIFVTEMLPADIERVKTKTPFEEWDKYQANVKAGYYHQFTRNTLQRNLGYQPGSDQVHFIEVARQAGVHATDWSWGALIFDIDNDGLRDIFVANGIVKDLTDFDYVDYYVNNQNLIAQYRKDSVLLTKMIDEFPSVPLQNYLFKNKGNFNFENIASDAGMSQLSFSTGAAYADLDNDGDLDLVVNNLNGEVFIFKNNARELYPENRYLQLDLGSSFGTKVILHAANQKFYAEHNPVKGYMSSIDHRMHFGLGNIKQLDSLEIFWPNGTYSTQRNVETNQLLDFQKLVSDKPWPLKNRANQNPLYNLSENQIPWSHQESNFIDFDRDRLRFHMISNEGPKIAVGDLNGNGLDDLCLPGAKGQASEIWLQQENGVFVQSQLLEEGTSEDIQALFFDADGDGDLDLYLASGSIEFGAGSPNYQDRLFINDGRGRFEPKVDALPQIYESTAFVKSFDFNQDGNMDLLVGGRAIPFAHGLPLDLRILENDGKGNFKIADSPVAEEFKKLGMMRDAIIADIDADGQEEIIVVGDWMRVKIFKLIDNKYQDVAPEVGLQNSAGIWNTIQLLDINGDGHLDILAGNMGLNTRLKANHKQPLQLYINDFDQNGSIEQILTQYEGDEAYPLVLKGTLLKQLPGLRKQILNYDAYKDKRMEDLFPAELLNRSHLLSVESLASSLFINDGAGKFTAQSLPPILQSAPIHAIKAIEGANQIWLGGNQSKIKPELGINMGSYAWVVDFSEGVNVLSAEESGVMVRGEIRDLQLIRTRKGQKIAVVRNNDSILLYDKN